MSKLRHLTAGIAISPARLGTSPPRFFFGLFGLGLRFSPPSPSPSPSPREKREERRPLFGLS